MLKRILEIFLGVMIIILLLGSYGDEHNPRKLLIGYLITNRLLQIIVTIGLVILASRLIAGKPKDYSRFFYNLLVELFGLPKKNGSNKRWDVIFEMTTYFIYNFLGKKC